MLNSYGIPGKREKRSVQDPDVHSRLQTYSFTFIQLLTSPIPCRHWQESHFRVRFLQSITRRRGCRSNFGHEPKDMTDDYTHSTIEMRCRAVSLLCQTSSENVLNFSVKSGRRLKREDDGNAKLLIQLVAGGRIELPTLGL